jgi:hypothetical protein
VWIVSAVAILSLVLLTGPARVRALEQPFDAGHQWGGAASFDDATGDLQHCRIEATYNSGITLALGLLSDFTLVLVLTTQLGRCVMGFNSRCNSLLIAVGASPSAESQLPPMA